MKMDIRKRMISLTLAAMMTMTPIGGAVFAADEAAAEAL